MQIGMLDHLQKWIFNFMKTHARLEKYNAIWLSMSAYHNLTPKTKSYDQVSQWNMKERKEMSQYLLSVVTQSLRGESPAQHPIFNIAIQCTQAVLEFYMYARYQSHHDATFSYLEDSLCHFHTFKEVFLLRQAGKRVRAKAHALRMELVKKRKVDKDANAETWTPSKMSREMDSWRDCISNNIEVFKELDADFNFPKIHLMSHWVKQIRQSGALQQYFAERHE
jgi:hypothetical protein